MSAVLTAQPGLHSTATVVRTKAKVKGKNRKRKKSTMTGGACATTSVHSADKLPPDILSACALCAPAQSVESLVMWAPIAQPQLRHALCLSLSKWATWDDLESESQGYKGGNVTVMEAPTSFSPFSLTDCTLYSHFSFDDFVMIAFPDLTGDLDDPI